MKKILFVCVANSCRSQMAESIARSLNPGSWQIDSAGGHPGGVIDSGARDYLTRHGYTLEGQSSKGFDDVDPLDSYDYLATLCSEACVVLPDLGERTKLLRWELSDPTGHVGEGRDAAYRHVEEFLVSHIRALFDDTSHS